MLLPTHIHGQSFFILPEHSNMASFRSYIFSITMEKHKMVSRDNFPCHEVVDNTFEK